MSSQSVSLDAPAVDDACIRIQPEGRLLKIQRRSVALDDAAHDDEGVSAPSDLDAQDHDRDVSARGDVTGFSEESRRRLRRYVHSLQRGADVLFLTLTYHETRPSPTRCKRDLDTFIKRLRRSFPEVGIIWKMEPQDRGVPHFHLLIYGVPFIPVQKWSAVWHEVTNEEGHAHRQSGVDIERNVNEDGKLQSYLAKYMSKTYDSWPGADKRWTQGSTGRWWGLRFRDRLPWAAWAEWCVYVDPRKADALVSELLDQWGIDLGGVLPPSLTICCRGNPEERLSQYLDRLDQ